MKEEEVDYYDYYDEDGVEDEDNEDDEDAPLQIKICGQSGQ